MRELNLDDMLLEALGGEREPLPSSRKSTKWSGPDMDIVWLEQRHIDPNYKRDARFRVALARGPAICLISMNYWSNRAAGLERVWDDVLRTLVFGEPIADSTAGPVIQ